jgi:hypothetical protein
MKLAIVQMVFGALVAVSSFISTRWGFPTEFTLIADESGMVRIVEVFPGPMQPVAHMSAFLALLLGLAVLGCGIAQFLKGAKPLLEITFPLPFVRGEG